MNNVETAINASAGRYVSYISEHSGSVTAIAADRQLAVQPAGLFVATSVSDWPVDEVVTDGYVVRIYNEAVIYTAG